MPAFARTPRSTCNPRNERYTPTHTHMSTLPPLLSRVHYPSDQYTTTFRPRAVPTSLAAASPCFTPTSQNQAGNKHPTTPGCPTPCTTQDHVTCPAKPWANTHQTTRSSVLTHRTRGTKPRHRTQLLPQLGLQPFLNPSDQKPRGESPKTHATEDSRP